MINKRRLACFSLALLLILGLSFVLGIFVTMAG